MAYLGNAPARSFISFERQVFTIVNSQTAYTLDHSVNNENDLRLVINNIVQEPGSGKAYTASGTTLTLSAALTNGTDEMYCVFLGRATATNSPGAGSVNTAAIAADAITEAKIADDAVESEHLNDNVISGQTELASEPADTDEFLVSDAGTLKRLDYSLIKASPGMEKIASASGTGSSGTISFTSCFTTSFDFYEIRGEIFTDDNREIDIQLLDTVGNAKTGYYYLGYNSYDNNSSASLYQYDGWGDSVISIDESHANSTTRGAPFTLSVFNPKNTSTGTSFIYRQHAYSSNGYFRAAEVMGGYNSAEAINGFKIFLSPDGNFRTQTKITVYGFKA